MCTALILKRAVPSASLVVAANRDEFYRRPALGPTVLLDRPRAVGGLDLEKRGSWFGVTPEGRLALLTNQPEQGGQPLADRRSRGEVVIEVLRQGPGWLSGIDGRDYNSFNLLFGTAQEMAVAYGRSDRREIEIEPVPDGLSVLPNARLDQPGHVKVGRGRELVERASSADDLAAALAGVLGDHRRVPLESLPDPGPGARFPREFIREVSALCIHTPEYGTRSSAIVFLEPGRTVRLLYAAGPPCVTPFEDATGLLA